METLTIQTENVGFLPLGWQPDDVIEAVSGKHMPT